MDYPLLRTVHSWLGVLLSTFVLVMAVSGIIALFFDDLQIWENPGLARIDLARQQPLQAIVASLADVHDLDPARGLHIRLATETRPTLGFELPLSGQEQKLRLELDPVSLRPLPSSAEGLTAFFRDLHVRLQLPAPGGNYLVGALGFVMLALIATGTLLHRNVLRALVTLRTRRGARPLVSDTHKLLGLWGLAFHLLITFSGATIGISHLLEAALGNALERLVTIEEARVVRPPPTPGQVAAPLIDLDDIVRGACADFARAEPSYVIVRGLGLEAARVEVRCRLPRELSRYATFRFDAASGQRLDEFVMHRDGTMFGRMFEAIVFLHVGDFLSTWLRMAYLALAVSLAMLAVSGSLIWVVARFDSNRRFDPGSRLLLGTQLGFLLAVATVILLYRLDAISFGVFKTYAFLPYSWLFIIAWGAVIAYFWHVESLVVSVRRVLTATALLILSGAVTNLLWTWQAVDEISAPAVRAVVVPDLLLGLFAGLILFARRILRAA